MTPAKPLVTPAVRHGTVAVPPQRPAAAADPYRGAKHSPILHLRIDELVLSGFEASRRYAIAGAIHRELERLFREGGVPSELSMGAPTDAGVAGGASVRRDVLTLNAGSFEIPHDATPETVGIQVARSIHRGLGGSTINAAQQGSRSGGFQGGAQS